MPEFMQCDAETYRADRGIVVALFHIVNVVTPDGGATRLLLRNEDPAQTDAPA